jgi:hypothetical protein
MAVDSGITYGTVSSDKTSKGNSRQSAGPSAGLRACLIPMRIKECRGKVGRFDALEINSRLVSLKPLLARPLLQILFSGVEVHHTGFGTSLHCTIINLVGCSAL